MGQGRRTLPGRGGGRRKTEREPKNRSISSGAFLPPPSEAGPPPPALPAPAVLLSSPHSWEQAPPRPRHRVTGSGAIFSRCAIDNNKPWFPLPSPQLRQLHSQREGEKEEELQQPYRLTELLQQKGGTETEKQERGDGRAIYLSASSFALPPCSAHSWCQPIRLPKPSHSSGVVPPFTFSRPLCFSSILSSLPLLALLLSLLHARRHINVGF